MSLPPGIKPIKSLGNIQTPNADLPAVPLREQQELSALKTATTDAVNLSLPRKSSVSVQAPNAADALDSLLDNIANAENLAAAHQGLDASRVFSLLEGSDEE